MQLQVLGEFRTIREDHRPEFSPNAARLLALLAVHDGPVPRALAAGLLWPDKNERRALANLRTTLWRVRSDNDPVLEDQVESLVLHPAVSVDLFRVRSMLDGPDELSPAACPELLLDLLPTWNEPWLAIPQMLWRQARLQYLDAACEGLVDRARFDEAAQLSRDVLASEPLRSSTARLLARAIEHIEGQAAARSVMRDHRERLNRAFGSGLPFSSEGGFAGGLPT